MCIYKMCELEESPISIVKYKKVLKLDVKTYQNGRYVNYVFLSFNTITFYGNLLW